MTARTILVAIGALLAGAAAVFGISTVLGSSEPAPVAPVEVAPRPAQPRQSTAQTRPERERRRPAQRSRGFERAPRPSAPAPAA